MIDPRIGRYDGEEPEVCAASGEPVQGRHSSQFPLDKEHYYRVMGKRQNAQGEPPNRAELETELRALIAENAGVTMTIEAEPPASKRVKVVKGEMTDVSSEQ